MSKNSTPNESIYALKTEEKLRAKSFLIGLSIFLLGIASIGFVFSSLSPQNLSYEDNAFQVESEFTDYNKGKINHNVGRKRDPNWITYAGSMKTFGAISFKLKKFDPTSRYVFDFGDGIQKDCKKGKITYRYHRPGTYMVKVMLYRKGTKGEAVWTKKIRIKKGFQIDPTAYQ